MTFSATSYFFNLAVLEVFLLLPAVYLAGAGKRTLFAFICLIGMFYITPRLIVLYAFFWTAVGLFVRLQRLAVFESWRRDIFIVGVLMCLAPLVAFKLFPLEFWIAWNREPHESLVWFWPRFELIDSLRPIITAVGLSFAVFRAIDLLVKVHIRKLRDVRFRDVLQYGFFAPVIVSGPIIEFEEIQNPTQVAPQSVFLSALVIGVGVVKVFIAAVVLREFSDISAIDAQSLLWRWILILVHPWYFYLNFSGYSDMAIGLAGLYGFVLKPNFNNPFFQPSVQDFWANWHMGLTRWAQRNIFIPLGGYRAKRQYVAIFLTMLGIAFWHDVSLSLLLFGVCHSLVLIIQRSVVARDIHLSRSGFKVPKPAKIVMTYIFVALSFPMLEMPFDRLLPVYRSLLGL